MRERNPGVPLYPPLHPRVHKTAGAFCAELCQQWNDAPVCTDALTLDPWQFSQGIWQGLEEALSLLSTFCSHCRSKASWLLSFGLSVFWIPYSDTCLFNSLLVQLNPDTPEIQGRGRAAANRCEDVYNYHLRTEVFWTPKAVRVIVLPCFWHLYFP